MLGSSIINGAYQLLGRPSQNDLPYEDVLEHTRDVVRGRTLDMKMSAMNHTAEIGNWVTPSAREMSTASFVGSIENFLPIKVEWRYASDDTSAMPRKAEVVAFEQLGDLYESGTQNTYAAFYNSLASIAFSEHEDTLALREYRVIYEDLEDVLALAADATRFPEIFIPLCKYEVALVCLNQTRTGTLEWADERERLRADFMLQVGVWTERFNKWRTSRFGNKKVSKVSAILSMRRLK